MYCDPLAIDQMSLFQFSTMLIGYQRAHCQQVNKAPSKKRFKERLDQLGIELEPDNDLDVDLVGLRERVEALG